MDTREDLIIYAIEKKVRRTRASQACDHFEQMSQAVALCLNCGHDEVAHEEMSRLEH